MRTMPIGLAAALALAACGEVAERVARPEAALHFTDVTQTSGIHMTLTSGDDPPTRLFEVKGNGVALVDYDNDGDPDVFVPNGATIANTREGPGCRLFENLGGLRFEDVTARANIGFRRWGYGATVADYDADGFDDIFVTCYGENALLRNTGAGSFVETTAAAGISGDEWSSGSAFGDIDGDGDLDLYVVNYAVLPATGEAPRSRFLGAAVFAGPMGLPGVPDVLWENQGDGTFRDVSESSGILEVPNSWGLGAVMLDFDGNGTLDIFVGNDSTGSFLFKNRGAGQFTEIGTVAGIALNEDGAGQATMGIAIGDVDSNGLADVFTTNFMSDTNTLHVNLGRHMYEDRTRMYGLFLDGRPYLGWAASFHDFDNDADEDLLLFNGHIYPEALCEERDWNYAQEALLYAREGPRFERQAADTAGAWLDARHCDRGAAFGDLDADGDIDVIVCERNGPLRVLRNDRDGGAWITIALMDARPGHERRGWGSKITVTAGETVQHRWIASGVSFLSANQPLAHFGLPADTETVRVEITWPDGQEQLVERVRAGEPFVAVRD